MEIIEEIFENQWCYLYFYREKTAEKGKLSGIKCFEIVNFLTCVLHLNFFRGKV